MKRLAIIWTVAVLTIIGCVAVFAQQPIPPPTPAQQAILKEAEGTQARLEAAYNKLRDITEFQQYLKARAEYEQLQQRYVSASKVPDAPKPEAPKATPAPAPKK
jgi:enamine deaminase RidA (YjgF/YER057c/UK114 family)